MEVIDLERLRRVLVTRLESLRRAGVLQLPRAKRLAETSVVLDGGLVNPPAAAQPSSAKSEAASPAEWHLAESPKNANTGWQPPDAGTLFGAGAATAVQVSSAATLEVLQQEVAGCTRCEELARTRTKTVFGVGNPNAQLCFIGEAPGGDEDKQGEPFVGRAGRLLTKIIEACRMKREEVYILNMIKCRPPGNRNPLPEELSNCRGYLERQLALVRPEFICCLGAVAAQNLLGTTLSIGKLRSKVHLHRGAKVVCTYHPAYLLRNPAAKKDTWDDMKLLMREMGVEL
jgi:uracil-DNA glycosylase